MMMEAQICSLCYLPDHRDNARKEEWDKKQEGLCPRQWEQPWKKTAGETGHCLFTVYPLSIHCLLNAYSMPTH